MLPLIPARRRKQQPVSLLNNERDDDSCNHCTHPLY